MSIPYKRAHSDNKPQQEENPDLIQNGGTEELRDFLYDSGSESDPVPLDELSALLAWPQQEYSCDFLLQNARHVAEAGHERLRGVVTDKLDACNVALQNARHVAEAGYKRLRGVVTDKLDAFNVQNARHVAEAG